MTNLRDYDRDATLIEKVRDLERQLADARASLDFAYAKGLADGRAERNRQNEQLREDLDLAYKTFAKGREDGRAEIERLLNELQDRNGRISRLKHELYLYRDRSGDE